MGEDADEEQRASPSIHYATILNRPVALFKQHHLFRLVDAAGNTPFSFQSSVSSRISVLPAGTEKKSNELMDVLLTLIEHPTS